MDGYSVTEAASVLGVPTERVWELLARGVLSGAPEGETGMRVYLQPRPGRAPVEPKGPNGDGGTREPERELSPFRELLTEFRNLTERYGQALLALGEARGEVASLRSRVDLLEARMDLRLPPGSPQAAGWSSAPMSPPLERAVVSAIASGTATDRPEMASPESAGRNAPDEPAEDDERPARARGPRRATESFAEALARAEDPSPPELPDGTEAAAALAALRHHAEASVDVALPREVPGAEPIPVAEGGDEDIVAVAAESAPVDAISQPIEVEPAPVGVIPEPIEAEPAPVDVSPEPIEAAPQPVLDEPHPTFPPAEAPIPLERSVEAVPAATASEPAAAEQPVAAEVEPEPEPVAAEVEHEPEPVAAHAEPEDESTLVAAHAEPEDESALVSAASAPPEQAREAEHEPAREPVVEPEPIAWDTERYTTDIEEPDWLAAEILEPPQPGADATPPDGLEAETESGTAPEDAPPETADVGGEAPETGADEMEVAAMGAPPTTADAPVGPARPFPGAQDLEDAIAALRAAGMASEPPEPEAGPEPRPAQAPSPELPRVRTEPGSDAWPPRSTSASPIGPASATRGPASRAYRRLRRIFPS